MTKRKLQSCGRQRALWGAVIPAIASIVGAGIGAASASRNQRRAIDAQNKEQERLNTIQRNQLIANNLNNYFSTLDENDENRYVYKSGGKRKLKNSAVITDGGYAIPLNSTTSLLQGSSHNQINEAGNTGIGIKVGNKEVEAEGGEVIQRKGNELRVFSAQPMLNGESPAEKVIEGKNKDKVFKQQESMKKKYKLRNGRSTPVERSKALWGATFTTPDYIGLGTNIAASLLANTVGRSSYNRLLNDINYTLPEYASESYIAGPTTYHNSAQRGEVERNRLNARNIISQNTASSNVATDRMQESDTNAMYQMNNLWDTKANKEIELRKANVERAQQVAARNAAARNQYYNTVAETRNKELATRFGIRQAMLDSNVGMIQGIGSSIGNFLQSGIDNYQADQARRMLLASSQYGSAERMASMGVDFDNNLMESLLSDATDRYNYSTSDSNRNAARESYNFWLNRLSKNDRLRSRYTNKYRLSTM